MIPRTARCLSLGLGLLLAGCCCFPGGDTVDLTVCDLSAKPRDVQPMSLPPRIDLAPPATDTPSKARPASPDKPKGDTPLESTVYQPSEKEQKSDAESQKAPAKNKAPTPPSRFKIPPALSPGGPIPPLSEVDPKTGKQRVNYAKVFPPLAPMGEDPVPVPGPLGKPLTLSDLQQLAVSNSPLIKQAAANVDTQRGAAIQAGLGPNPTIGLEIDTFGTTGGAGYYGGFVDQVIKTANKLQLARAVAVMDLRNAEVALKRAEFDLMTRVRTGYFAVLVAQESMRLNRAVVTFTQDVYGIQLDMARKGGQVAAYEPMYLRALTVQARGGLVQARNAYLSAWKQLAANMGLPGLPPTQLCGHLDVPIPYYDHKDVLAHVLAHHTDFMAAENSYLQAKYNLRLQRVTPIPDMEVRFMLQKDQTGPPFELAGSAVVSFPVPVWNRNQGAIMQAQGQVAYYCDEMHRVRTVLTGNLALAFQRYQDNRILLGYYRDEILPDYVRVLREIYKRYNKGEPGGAGFADVIVAQQNLVNAVGTYITTLGAQWQAVVDVTDLLQTTDLFQLNNKPVPVEKVHAIPELPRLPCSHPCSPVPHLHQTVLDPTWPLVAPLRTTLPSPAGTRDKKANRPKKAPAEKNTEPAKQTRPAKPKDLPDLLSPPRKAPAQPQTRLAPPPAPRAAPLAPRPAPPLSAPLRGPVVATRPAQPPSAPPPQIITTPAKPAAPPPAPQIITTPTPRPAPPKAPQPAPPKAPQASPAPPSGPVTAGPHERALPPICPITWYEEEGTRTCELRNTVKRTGRSCAWYEEHHAPKRRERTSVTLPPVRRAKVLAPASGWSPPTEPGVIATAGPSGVDPFLLRPPPQLSSRWRQDTQNHPQPR